MPKKQPGKQTNWRIDAYTETLLNECIEFWGEGKSKMFQAAITLLHQDVQARKARGEQPKKKQVG